MTPKEKIREVIKSDDSFRLYVAETIGELSADVRHLVNQSTTQFQRLDSLDKDMATCATTLARINTKGCGNHPMSSDKSVRPSIAASFVAAIIVGVVKGAEILLGGKS